MTNSNTAAWYGTVLPCALTHRVGSDDREGILAVGEVEVLLGRRAVLIGSVAHSWVILVHQPECSGGERGESSWEAVKMWAVPMWAVLPLRGCRMPEASKDRHPG